MLTADRYQELRTTMTDLGRTLSPEQASAVVPACPSWSVKDVYSHMAGNAADILAGNIAEAGTDPWTAAQVEARRDRSLAEVLDEWDRLGPQVEDALKALEDMIDPRLIVDQWTHEQDLRGAVGRPGGRDSSTARWCAGRLTRGFEGRARAAGLQPLTVDFGDEQVHPKEGSPAGTVAVDRFEFVRAGMGRRSRAQVRAWAWSVDPGPYVGTVAVFPARETDLVE